MNTDALLVALAAFSSSVLTAVGFYALTNWRLAALEKQNEINTATREQLIRIEEQNKNLLKKVDELQNQLTTKK